MGKDFGVSPIERNGMNSEKMYFRYAEEEILKTFRKRMALTSYISRE